MALHGCVHMIMHQTDTLRNSVPSQNTDLTDRIPQIEGADWDDIYCNDERKEWVSDCFVGEKSTTCMYKLPLGSIYIRSNQRKKNYKHGE